MSKKIIKLYHEKRELLLLQIFFGSVAVIFFILAGFVALFNQALGVGILIVPFVFFISLLVNTVAWALIKSFIEFLEEKNVEQSPKQKPAKKTK